MTMTTAGLLEGLRTEELSLAERFSLLDRAKQIAFLEKIYKQGQYESYRHNWSFWGRPEQMLPTHDDWDVLFFMAGRAGGKALSLDTPIATPYGWTTMGEINPGDIVFDEQGNPTKVLYATVPMFDHKCYRVTFSDGEEIIADEEHLWITHDKSYRKSLGRRVSEENRVRHWGFPTTFPTTVTTRQIKDSLYVGRKDGKRELNHAIPLAGCLDLPDADLLIDPYVLGIWLGDGDSKSAVITTCDAEVLEEIKLAGYGIERTKQYADRAPRYQIGKTYRGEPSSLTKILRLQGVLQNKHIPNVYLRSSARQRLALLQGLMDSDGHCGERGKCEFTTTKIEVANGFHELCASLSIRVRMTIGDATLNGVSCGPKYRFLFRPEIPVFRLSRKRIRQEFKKAQRSKKGYRYITDVSEVDSVPVRCIRVDSPSHLFLAGKGMIPTHNTRSGSEIINKKAENRDWYFVIVGETAAEVRDVMIEGPSGIVNTAKPWNPVEYYPSKRRLVWPKTGSWATTFSGDAPDQLRGPHAHFAWVDEIAKYRNPQEVWDQLEFVMRAGDHPQIVVTSTPRPIKLVRDLIKDERTVLRTWATYRNIANVAPTYINRILSRYEGTRLGRQELRAQILDENENALWSLRQIDELRVSAIPHLHTIVVGVDPPGSESTECGIVVMGLDQYEHMYCLDDMSINGKPEVWGGEVIAAYNKWHADLIVPEVNFGGDMVTSVLRAIDSTVPIKAQRASRGKYIRAQPISTYAEQGKIHHVGTFAALEDEMTNWEVGDDSPNRLDAYVWAGTALLEMTSHGLRSRTARSF